MISFSYFKKSPNFTSYQHICDPVFSASFLPMEFPQVPQRLSFKRIPILQELRDKLQRGELSLNEVETELANLEFYQNEFFASANEFSSMKNEDLNTFKIEEIEEEDQDMSQSFEANDDSFVNVPIESVSSVQEEEEEDNEAHPQPEPSPKAIESNSAEQRLEHVEQMLQTLMNQMNEQKSTNQESHTSAVRTPQIRPSLVSTGTSMVSALTNSDNIGDGGGGVKQNDTQERERLLQEIEYLKRQLAYAQQYPPNYVNALNETGSISTGVRQQKKKRKRKLIKKPWK